jgi:hypothetical protein
MYSWNREYFIFLDPATVWFITSILNIPRNQISSHWVSQSSGGIEMSSALERLELVLPSLKCCPPRNGLACYLKSNIILEHLIHFFKLKNQTRPCLVYNVKAN